MSNVLRIDNLSKSYGRQRALDHVSFTLDKGQILGLLGPNGSGKTTCLGILLGVLQPSSGSYSWFNQSPSAQVRRRIGALLEQPNFYPWLSAEDNLKVFAQLRESKANVDQALKEVGLYERRKDNFKTYSLGMKQRLSIAAAIMGDPEVLLLDEPTNGVDAKGISEIRQIILNQARQGRTVLLASHILDEVEKTCSHVVVLKEGQVLQAGSIQEVLHGDPSIEVEAIDKENLKQALTQIPEVLSMEAYERGFRVHIKGGWSASDLNRALYEKDVVLSHLASQKKSLESHFLKLLEGSHV